MADQQTDARDALMRAARLLFANRGLAATSVEEICEQASVNEGLFRAHFASKEDLLRSILDEWSEAHLRRLHEVDTTEMPFEQKLHLLVAERRRLIADLGPILLREMHAGGPELQRFIAERGAENRERFAAFLVAAQERGEVRRDVGPEVLFGMLEKMDEFCRDPTMIGLAGGVDELSRIAFAVFLHGALTGK